MDEQATEYLLMSLRLTEGLDEARYARLADALLDEDAIRGTLGVVLKHASDQEKAVRELKLAAGAAARRR